MKASQTYLVIALGLAGRVDVVNARAEEAGQDEGLRERFDVVVARAVAPLCVLAEYCLPLAKIGGVWLAQKGGDVAGEIEQARHAIGVLGGEIRAVHAFVLPDGSARTVIEAAKVAPAPVAYPRRPGLPEKKPL